MKVKKNKPQPDVEQMCFECDAVKDIKYEYKGELYCKKCYDSLMNKKQENTNE